MSAIAARRGDFERVRDHARTVVPVRPIRHRRTGRTSVSTRGWRRQAAIHPRADDAHGHEPYRSRREAAPIPPQRAGAEPVRHVRDDRDRDRRRRSPIRGPASTATARWWRSAIVGAGRRDRAERAALRDPDAAPARRPAARRRRDLGADRPPARAAPSSGRSTTSSSSPALRLELVPALIVSAVAVVGELRRGRSDGRRPRGRGSSALAFSVHPVVPRHPPAAPHVAGRATAPRQLVEELRESRAAHAESAALAERGRVARDMHDVLAHSLSALALQLEGARLLARDRGADPEVVAADRARAPPRRRRAWSRRARRSARCAATSCPGPSASSSWPTRSPATAG